MHVYGRDSIETTLKEKSYLFKLLVNDHGVLLFSRDIEHEQISEPDIRYEPDSVGNALAGVVKPGHIELRHHNDFGDERVHLMMERLLALPEMEFARDFEVVYQGRVLIAKPLQGED
ncbi:hypothetical protein C5Y96_06390 [Blastopirellula marina]|uniref:Uncharacterized protein n=1 Tax=Blastopirellula marina TaxID=124 RepID=A0A2S8FX87_9BACT|nr:MULTISPECIES: hypothetical protein [Pirellulaceae]PQO36792.1 hypothetical protein C5Y96_06390 [Blastopirellula marina]RCS53507.1 hypothetical protein DTL36_06400 [Bremerella cremea]